MSGLIIARLVIGRLITKMKTKYHFPTEQFGFLEMELELKDTATLEDVCEVYKKLKTAWNKKEEDKKIKVASSMRAKEIANPIDHIDISLEELPINE